MNRDEYFSAYQEMLYEENNNLGDLYTEKLITFGNKSYPQYNNVVIIAGGSGSGKGFQIANMLGIDTSNSKILDIDHWKALMIKSKYFQKIIQEKYNIDITKINWSNPEDTRLVHKIFKELRLSPRFIETILSSVKNYKEKPNLIFDKTCSDLKDISNISVAVQEAGYKKENIHLVWVLTKYETALIQNTTRDRQVPNDVILAAHIGTANVFNTILMNPSLLNNFIDGDIYISFNQAGTDTKVALNNNNKLVVTDFNYVQIKEQGKPIQPVKEIKQEVFDKISDYVPTNIVKNSWKHIKDFA